MVRVESVDQYKQLIRDNKKRFSKVITNCMMMSSSMAPHIREGRLYCKAFDNGLVVYIDEEIYYNVYYYWNAEAPFEDFRRDKPVLLEELSNDGSRDEYIARISEKLKEKGFELFKSNLQFEKNLLPEEDFAGAAEEQTCRLEKKNIRIGICVQPEHIAQVGALWRKLLDETDVPSNHFRFDEYESNTVICAFNEKNEVVGTYWWNNEGRDVCECRHIVTREDYFRNGIASALLSTCTKMQAERSVKKMTTWISEQNVKSIQLHESAGFIRNGRSSKQFILK